METLPLEVAELPTPTSPPVPAFSPPIDSKDRRNQYQQTKVEKHNDTELPGSADASAVDQGQVSKPKENAKETEVQEEFSESGQEAGGSRVEPFSNHPFFKHVRIYIWKSCSGIFDIFCGCVCNDRVVVIYAQIMISATHMAQDPYVTRSEQLQLKPESRGRGRGRGKGRGGKGRGKAARQDELEEGENGAADEDEAAKKPQTPAVKGKRRRGKQPEDPGPDWTEEMCEEWAKWKWGEAWQEWETEGTWDCWDHKKSFDRAANLDAKLSLYQISEHKKDEKEDTAKTSKTVEEDEQVEEETKVDKTKASKKRTQTKDEKQEEPVPKKRNKKQEKEAEDTVVPDPVPQKQRDQINMIIGFIKDVEELNIKKIQKLTKDDRTDLKKLMFKAEETRYNAYYKRPGFGLHSKVEDKDVAYFIVDGCNDDFMYRLGASMGAASMMAARKNI